VYRATATIPVGQKVFQEISDVSSGRTILRSDSASPMTLRSLAWLVGIAPPWNANQSPTIMALCGAQVRFSTSLPNEVIAQTHG
jgi:hypothetical protein